VFDSDSDSDRDEDADDTEQFMLELFWKEISVLFFVFDFALTMRLPEPRGVFQSNFSETSWNVKFLRVERVFTWFRVVT
jgi:hypothetical protein